MNKQPFYHKAEVLFTASREYSGEELQRLLRTALELAGDTVIFGKKKPEWVGQLQWTSLEVETVESEAGDPADLL